jgi:hypothetical protein
MLMDEKPCKNIQKSKRGRGVGMSNQFINKHWNNVGLFATQWWISKGIAVNRARHTQG